MISIKNRGAQKDILHWGNQIQTFAHNKQQNMEEHLCNLFTEINPNKTMYLIGLFTG